MVFVKNQKTRAYSKRFQVKPKRRRQGKTDYRARLRLTNQDKNKYNTPKYRFVGALDGGLDIPHSDKRFAGFKKDEKQLDAEVHRKYIYGGHVADYMKSLAEEEPEKYQSHFSEYIKRGIEADGMEAMYKKVHAAIRADPTMAKSTKEPPKTHTRYNLKKLTYEQRKASLVERLNALNSSAGADVDEDDDE
ncbi:large ribosomal subunit protein uL18z-like [Lolium perenne]|uniref:large ribosomal subunit protein uL18z-like n=1 Tax=Lolium perenne TaxID=4522 RepID=UPI0021EA3F02|nr:60S ribosomal protein L5-1-like [Lolium perenne]